MRGAGSHRGGAPAPAGEALPGRSRARERGDLDTSAEAIHAAALDLLGRREHSRRELARKLRRRGFPREGIEAVLERLEGVGLVSDERYARLYVRDKLTVNPQGRRRILRGLRAKGIDAGLAEGAVEEVYEETGASDHEAAAALARKRMKVLAGLDPQVARRRLGGYLARRGFDGRVVSEVLQEGFRPFSGSRDPAEGDPAPS